MAALFSVYSVSIYLVDAVFIATAAAAIAFEFKSCYVIFRKFYIPKPKFENLLLVPEFGTTLIQTLLYTNLSLPLSLSQQPKLSLFSFLFFLECQIGSVDGPLVLVVASSCHQRSVVVSSPL